MIGNNDQSPELPYCRCLSFEELRLDYGYRVLIFNCVECPVVGGVVDMGGVGTSGISRDIGDEDINRYIGLHNSLHGVQEIQTSEHCTVR